MQALLALGFRPFYLLAGAFSALSIAVWTAQFSGALPTLVLEGPLWHAHEMIFGYTFAVIVGFLFTAGRNWTNQPTPTGATLALIATLWLTARVLAMTRWPFAGAFFDVAFALAAAVGLAIPMWRSRNRRNYFFPVLLLAIGALNAAFHLALAGRVSIDLSRTIVVALDIVLFIIAVMGGRVIPMFTNNGVPGTGARRIDALEKVALGAVLALIAADLLAAPGWLAGAVALVAALAHGWRLALWRPWRTLRHPLVWILHAAYAWIVVHLAMRAGAFFGVVPQSVALHALTVGAIGGITVGMMTRTSRGHTGRQLVAGKPEAAAYLLVMAAAIVRVFGPLLLPSQTLAAIVLSGVLWAGAFAVFTVAYWPVLAHPRIDGKPG